MKKLMFAAVAALTLGFATTAKAENDTWKWSPIGLGIVAPAQIPFTDSHVHGLRLGGLFALNEDVLGLDCGLANVAGGVEYALQLGAVNIVKGDFGGIQLGVVNYDAALTSGFQCGLSNWTSFNFYGLQLGGENVAQRYLGGFAIGAINYSDTVEGAQIGAINLANDVTGCQIGVINACDNINGIQIGAINLITTSPVPVLPLVNVWF